VEVGDYRVAVPFGARAGTDHRDGSRSVQQLHDERFLPRHMFHILFSLSSINQLAIFREFTKARERQHVLPRKNPSASKI